MSHPETPTFEEDLAPHANGGDLDRGERYASAEPSAAHGEREPERGEADRTQGDTYVPPPSARTSPPRRIYLGRLPHELTKADITDFLVPEVPVNNIGDINLRDTFAFVELIDMGPDAIEGAVKDLQGKQINGGVDVVVQIARERDRERGPQGAPRRDGFFEAAPRGPRPGRGVPVIVRGLAPNTSWQDLKDFGRDGGQVLFADITQPGEGVVEFPSVNEARDAVRRLERSRIHDVQPEVFMDTGRRPDPYARSGGGGGGGYGGFPDRRSGGGSDDYARRRSPPRGYGSDSRGPPSRGYDERAPPSRGYDERAPPPVSRGGYDERGYSRRDRSPPPRRRDDEYRSGSGSGRYDPYERRSDDRR